MIPDRLQYFLDGFWNDQKCDQIWTLGHRICHQKALNVQENLGTSLKHIMFHIWEYDILKMLEGQCTKLFEFWNLKFQNWKVEIGEFEN